jgi:hypothetical protein
MISRISSKNGAIEQRKNMKEKNNMGYMIGQRDEQNTADQRRVEAKKKATTESIDEIDAHSCPR